MTALKFAQLANDLAVAGLDRTVWMSRIRLVADNCDIFARPVPDNADCFHLQDGQRPEDCRCYVRVIPPGPETVSRHPARGPRDRWTAVLDACCYSHQAAAVDWDGRSPLSFRLTTTASRPDALEAAAGMLERVAPTDQWVDDHTRCLPGYESGEDDDCRSVCLPCEDEAKIRAASRTTYYRLTADDDDLYRTASRAYYLLTADDQEPVHLCYACAEIAHAIIEERWSTGREYDKFGHLSVFYFLQHNGIPLLGAAVWRPPYSECGAE